MNRVQTSGVSKLNTVEWVAFGLCAAVFVWSGIQPHDRFTWWLEVAPGLIAFGLVGWAWRKGFAFSTLVLVLIAVHACILFVGGKYTYAEVPVGNWLRDHFHLSRNHYDKVGHTAQGFIPAMAVRELLLRKKVLVRGGWLFFLVTCVCLAASAFYEFIEWWVAIATGSRGDAFLGTQGYVWDTQSDMFACLVGAMLSLTLLSKTQDRSMIARLGESAP
jgi:putative membrane protein